MDKKFIIITSAPREYIWENSYIHNLSGQIDSWDEIGSNPNYRKGELCLIHPKIVSFYKNKKDFFNEEFKKGVTKILPRIIDKTREGIKSGYILNQFPKDQIPCLACDTPIKIDIFGETILDKINAEYILIPLKSEEFLETSENSLESILALYEKSHINLSDKNKIEIRRKLAILKSFDIYLNEKAINIKDIPVEITKRVGEIDRTKLIKKE